MSAAQTADKLIAEALPDSHHWEGRPGPAELAPLPGCPAVLLLCDAAGRPVHLLTTQHLKRTVTARLTAPQRPRRGKADLAEIVRGVRWRRVSARFEADWRYYRLARVLHPQEYRRLVSFGPAWFLHVDWRQRIPELRVSEQVWTRSGEFIGPWPTRQSCQEALEELWDLFDLCRYPQQIRRAPRGRRCAYAEMGRCDAPCDGSVPLAGYLERCRSAWEFAGGAKQAWLEALTARMKQAAAEQRYELAAQFRRRRQRASTWHERPDIGVRPVEQLNYLLALPAVRRRAWKLFAFWRGHLLDGPLLADKKLAQQAPVWLAEAFGRAPEQLDPQVRMEQTWLVAGFLARQEAQAAIVVPLPQGGVPAGLEDTLREASARRRARKTDQPET